MGILKFEGKIIIWTNGLLEEYIVWYIKFRARLKISRGKLKIST